MTPVMGNLRNLNYDYYFDSRDGSEREVNSQGAQSIVQLLQFIFKIPGVAQKLGMKGLLDAVNLVIRMSGAPWNFQFDLPVGQSQALPADQPAGGANDQQMQQMAQALAGLGMGVQKIEQFLMTALHADPRIFGIQPGAPGSPGAPGGHTALHPQHPGMVQAALPPAGPGQPPAVPSAPPGPEAPSAPGPSTAPPGPPSAAQTLAEPS